VGPLAASLLALMLLFFRALLWAGDAALASVSVVRAKELAGTTRAGQDLFHLKTVPEDSAAAIRMGLTLTLVFAAGLAAYAGSHLVPPQGLELRAPQFAKLIGPGIGGLAVALVVSVTDLVSRALGAASGEAYALFVARPVRAVSRFVSPFLRSVAGALELLLAPFGAKVTFAPAPPPLEEIERMLAEEAGKRVDQKAPALIHSIFELSEKTARDVMVPRTEIVALNISASPEEIVQHLSEEGHSRMPVYADDVDRIVGVLHARDLVPLLSNPQLIKLQDLLRPANFVPWSKKIGELLRDMQKKRIHMAMVVDEYGGFMGVVTLEDILREIVGEMGDEYTRDEQSAVETLADGSFLVQGDMPLDAFNQSFSVHVPEGEYETVSGFLYALAGSIPELGDRFFFGGLQFTVSERTPKQIKRVRVLRVKKPAAPERPNTAP
jgi:CBS domain containing-hemolysin-like protein